jgi:hypothetical protein
MPMMRRTTTHIDWRCLSAVALALLSCKSHDARQGPGLPQIPRAETLAEDATDEQNTIAGSPGGLSFPQVAAAFVIESPDSDATTVIYLLSKPVRCLDLSFAGWDRTIAKGTSILELKVLGKAPGSFLVVTTTPSKREGSADWTRTAEPQPVEVHSTGGWIILDTLLPRGPATGSFSLEFERDQLAGKFNATFCAGGHEP